MRILSLESSTSAAKAMFYDTQSGEAQVEAVDYLPEYNLPDGTQDAEGIFQQTAAVAKRVCAGLPVDMIALVGAWHSVMLCHRDGKPATRIYSWAATHAKDICARLRENMDYVCDYYQKTGCMVNAIYPYFKLLYLREQGYELSDYRIMGQGSYNVFRLTGAYQTSDCMASGSGLMNIHERAYDAQLLASLGISQDNLCGILHYDQTISLSPEGAELLGLKPGIPVIAACSDGGMNQMAIGGYREGVMSFSVGTSAAIRLSTAAPVLPDEPGTWCYLSPVGYMSGAATSGACNCISWYKDAFLPDMSFGEIEKHYQYDMDTPVFLPFLFGERCPGWQDGRRAAFAEVSPVHRPISFYQAICEGILFNVYQCYHCLLKANPMNPRIVLSGGILNSPEWTQMCADIFNHPMEVPENQQSSLWGGVVMCVMLSMGKAAADELMGKCRVVYPDAQRHAVYMKKFRAYMRHYGLTINANVAG